MPVAVLAAAADAQRGLAAGLASAPYDDPGGGSLSGEPDLGPAAGAHPGQRPGQCTAAQLRRFIKSRAYIPLHELRRRFLIEGTEDDVTGLDVDGARLYVGLPDREGRLLGELLRGGEVGYELSQDPATPIVVGVFPMRPIPRP